MSWKITSALAASLLGLASPALADTPGRVVDDLYRSISGDVGEARDWDLYRSLFVDGADTYVVMPTADGQGRYVHLSVESYIERSGPWLERVGFVEHETRRMTYNYGGLATIFSAFEGVRQDTGETVSTGINTFTLIFTDGEWKIAASAWRDADEDWPVERGFEPVD